MMSAGFMSALLFIDLHGMIELHYLAGIFATKMAGEQVKF
jgi:hypothetical protein